MLAHVSCWLNEWNADEFDGDLRDSTGERHFGPALQIGDVLDVEVIPCLSCPLSAVRLPRSISCCESHAIVAATVDSLLQINAPASNIGSDGKFTILHVRRPSLR